MNSTPARSVHNPALDTVRVLATLLVVVYHASGGFTSGLIPMHPSFLGPALNRLNVGVPIFFVLSGYLVGRPFVARFIFGAPAPSVGRFALQRVARVMPAYWLALAVLVPLGGAGPIPDASGWIRNILLIHPFTPENVLTGLGQSWTLSIEMSFYLSLPLLFWVLAFVSRPLGLKGRTTTLVGVLLVLVASAYGFQLVAWNNPDGVLRTAHLWLPGHMDTLALGVLLAVLVELRSHSRRADLLARQLVRLTGPLLLASALAWFASTRVGYPLTFSQPVTFRTFLSGHALFTVSSFLFFIPFCLAPSGSPIMRWSSVRPVAWLASISYGVYLWHMGFLDTGLFSEHMPFTAGDGDLFIRLAVVIPASIVVAAISHRFIEHPLIRLAKGRPRNRGTDSPAGAAAPRDAVAPSTTG